MLVLGGMQEFGARIVEPLVPIYSRAIVFLDDRFTITGAQISQRRASEVLSFRANLAGPVFIGGAELDPFGWAQGPQGGFLITYTVGGTLQFVALLLIAVLAWPAGQAREMAWRMAVALPLGGVLLILDIPITVVAGLRNFLATSADPNGLSGWMVASRFLMGGGGDLIALVIALFAVETGQRLCSLRSPASQVTQWRRVSRAEFEAFFRAYPGALDVCPPFAQPARRHTLRDRALGEGRMSWVAECRTRRNKSLYRIRANFMIPR